MVGYSSLRGYDTMENPPNLISSNNLHIALTTIKKRWGERERLLCRSVEY